MTAPTATSVDRLTRQLQAADSKLGQSLEALAAALAPLEEAQERIEDGLEALQAITQDLRATVESEGGVVDGGLQRLAAAAAGGAEEGIPGVAGEVREARSACGASLEEAAAGLEERGTALQENGLESLRSGLVEVGERDDTSGAEARAALEGLAEGCESVAAALGASGSEASARLGEVAAGLTGDLAGGLVQSSEEAIAELDAEAAATQEGASRVESEIVAAYGAWIEDVEAARAAHAELMIAAVETARGTLAEVLESGFYAPCQALEAGPLQGAQETLGQFLGSADGWALACDELGTTVDELQEGHAAMGRINQAARGPGS